MKFQRIERTLSFLSMFVCTNRNKFQFFSIFTTANDPKSELVCTFEYNTCVYIAADMLFGLVRRCRHVLLYTHAHREENARENKNASIT